MTALSLGLLQCSLWVRGSGGGVMTKLEGGWGAGGRLWDDLIDRRPSTTGAVVESAAAVTSPFIIRTVSHA